MEHQEKGILFKRNGDFVLEAYTLADHDGSIVDRRSRSGYCTFLCRNLVTWKSNKKMCDQGVCELPWLKIILEDLNIRGVGTMRLYCDNKFGVRNKVCSKCL